MTPARRQAYSPLRHLAWCIWLNHDPKDCFIAVLPDFQAAYDTSGSEGDKDGALVVVAVVATEHKWMKFENQWRAVLREFDVPYLHMRELHHRHSGKGAYAKWKGDDVEPRRFLKALIKVVKRGVNKTFCYGLVLKDYQQVNKEFKLKEGGGSPYVLAAGSCYDQVNNWMMKRNPKSRIYHVFESGDCGQRDLKRLAESRNRILILMGKTDRSTGERWPQFQAADLIAGAYRNAANKMGKVTSMEDYGEVFNDLAVMLPQKSLILHEGNLREHCEANPAKFPRRT